MKYILPIAAMLCSVVATLTAVVFCLGMGANSSEAEIRQLKLWMAGLSLLGACGVAAGIFLLRAGQFNAAAGAAITPTIIVGIVFIVALLQ